MVWQLFAPVISNCEASRKRSTGMLNSHNAHVGDLLNLCRLGRVTTQRHIFESTRKISVTKHHDINFRVLIIDASLEVVHHKARQIYRLFPL